MSGAEHSRYVIRMFHAACSVCVYLPPASVALVNCVYCVNVSFS